MRQSLRGDMAAEELIDTGAIIALLDRGDRWHRPCQDTLRKLRLPLLTSEAVLTETFHLIHDRGQRLRQSGASFPPG